MTGHMIFLLAIDMHAAGIPWTRLMERSRRLAKMVPQRKVRLYVMFFCSPLSFFISVSLSLSLSLSLALSLLLAIGSGNFHGKIEDLDGKGESRV